MACIGIDCRFGSLPVGLGTYTRGLVPRLLPLLKGHHVCLFVQSKDEDWLRELPKNTQIIECDARHYSISEQLLLPRRISQLSIDLWYSLHFNVPLLSSVPFIATVHDLTLHKYPNAASLPKRLAYLLLMRHAVTKAKEVVAVSNYTAADIRQVYGKVATVVSEGVDPMFTKKTADESLAVVTSYNLGSDFFLYVGGNKEHKNVQMLIDAYEESGIQDQLVLVTGRDAMKSLKLCDGVTVLSDVPAHDLPYFYSAAKCFVTPSLYEGFCLPVLEARACGCPVIATNLTAIPEVAGRHAALVTPTVTDLASVLREPPKTPDAPEKSHDWNAVASDISVILLGALHG